ncbi:MAG: FtsX-like permease family protein [Reichenbachiella sp.]|uniref:ABC transporter permease n=1 Tax=Reichenbachiella sp. TaxID=2184521 RepID=UPI003266D4EC
MVSAYIKIVFRQLIKSKDFLVINVLGLAVALSACLIIWQFANYHLNFDSFYGQGDQLYRVSCHIRQGDIEDSHSAALSTLIGPTANDQLPEVETYGRFWNISYMNHSLIYKNEDEISMFSEKKVYLVDASVFDLFELDFVYGSALAFEGNNKMVLSESSAIKYFGQNDPVGETLTLASNMGDHEYEVVGVVRDLPTQTHVQFDLLLTFDAHKKYYENSANWQRFNTMNYLKLKKPEEAEEVAAAIQLMIDENVTAKKDQRGYEYEIYLEAIKDIHLYSKVSDSFKTGADATLIYALIGITVLILVIAWINYLNLAMVRAFDRMREIGVRRVFGANNKQLASLFIMEALLVNLIAFVLALTLSQLGSPYVSQLTDLQIAIFSQPLVLMALLATVLFGAVITGLYPLALLKVLKTADVLTGRKIRSIGRLQLRQMMILLQFTVTFILVAGTVTIYKQITFMKSADLGINIDDTLIIKSPPANVHNSEDEGQQAYNLFKTDLVDQSAVRAVTNAGEAPGEPISWRATSVRLKNASENIGINTGLVSMGLNYREFFDIELLAGRWYRPGDSPWRKKDCVINLKLAKRLGFEKPEDAVGAEIAGFFAPVIVRGVVEDYHHESLHAGFEPVIYILSDWTEYYFVRLNIDRQQTPERQFEQLKSTMAIVEAAWDRAFITPMDYTFLDEKFNQQYHEDERLGKVFGMFALLAIFIAALGLYGMFSFSLRQKVKEIGIRKVLGAHVIDLTRLLTANYLKILLIAYLISVPLYLYLTDAWLNNYTFRIEKGLWIYWMPLVLIITISISAVITRLIKSINDNPIKALRQE